MLNCWKTKKEPGISREFCFLFFSLFNLFPVIHLGGKWNKLVMNSEWLVCGDPAPGSIKMSPNPVTSVCIRRRKFGPGHSEREGNHVNMEAEIWVVLTQAKEHHGLLAPTRSYKRQRGTLPQSLGGSVALPTPWFQTPGLQNWEGINFCDFKPLCLWDFVTAAPENWYGC